MDFNKRKMEEERRRATPINALLMRRYLKILSRTCHYRPSILDAGSHSIADSLQRLRSV
jgi:hypothetical protein